MQLFSTDVPQTSGCTFKQFELLEKYVQISDEVRGWSCFSNVGLAGIMWAVLAGTVLGFCPSASAASYPRIAIDQEAKPLWEFWFNFLLTHCLHGTKCAIRQREGHCNFGSRW